MLSDPCRLGEAHREEKLSSQVQRRTRRHRTIFTEEQLDALEELFLQNQYPDVNTREKLAQSTHLREERVEVRLLSHIWMKDLNRDMRVLEFSWDLVKFLCFYKFCVDRCVMSCPIHLDVKTQDTKYCKCTMSDNKITTNFFARFGLKTEEQSGGVRKDYHLVWETQRTKFYTVYILKKESCVCVCVSISCCVFIAFCVRQTMWLTVL